MSSAGGTPNGASMKSAVSLVDEHSALADVVESAQLIAELLATGGLSDCETTRRAPSLLVAVLAIFKGRLRLLRKVALQEVDSTLLVGRHNARQAPVRRGEDQYVLLPSRPRRRKS